MIQSISPTVCQPSQVMLTIHPEPYPIWDGPAAFVMPGNLRSIGPQAYGDGRYFHGFEGNFTVRFMDRSFKDRAYSNQLMLTDSNTNPGNITKNSFLPARLFPSRIFPNDIYSFIGVQGSAVGSNGILRNAHIIIDNLNLRFAYSLDDNSVLTEEPLILQSQTFGMYRGASEWGYTDLNFYFKFYQPYIFPVLPDIHSLPFYTTGTLFPTRLFPKRSFSPSVYGYYQIPLSPVSTNLADILLAVQSKIVSNGVFTSHQSKIVLEDEVFPMQSGPFCSISPIEFSFEEPDTYGAGRAFSTMSGRIKISPVVQNISDLSGQANYALTDSDPTLGLLTLVEKIQEYLDISFLADTNGNCICTEPMILEEIGKPYYYGGEAKSGPRSACNYVGIPLTFLVKYAQNLTQNPSWGPA